MQELLSVYILFFFFENFMDEYHVYNNNKENVVRTLTVRGHTRSWNGESLGLINGLICQIFFSFV